MATGGYITTSTHGTLQKVLLDRAGPEALLHPLCLKCLWTLICSTTWRSWGFSSSYSRKLGYQEGQWGIFLWFCWPFWTILRLEKSWKGKPRLWSWGAARVKSPAVNSPGRYTEWAAAKGKEVHLSNSRPASSSLHDPCESLQGTKESGAFHWDDSYLSGQTDFCWGGQAWSLFLSPPLLIVLAESLSTANPRQPRDIISPSGTKTCS